MSLLDVDNKDISDIQEDSSNDSYLYIYLDNDLEILSTLKIGDK